MLNILRVKIKKNSEIQCITYLLYDPTLTKKKEYKVKKIIFDTAGAVR